MIKYLLLATLSLFLIFSESSAFADEDTQPTILEIIKKDPELTSFVTTIHSAGLDDLFQNPGSLTVFAPTNKAFDNLPLAYFQSLLIPDNSEKLKVIMNYHILNGKKLSADFQNSKVLMRSGDLLQIKKEGDVLKVNDATVVNKDIDASNGVVDKIDSLLIPES